MKPLRILCFLLFCSITVLGQTDLRLVAHLPFDAERTRIGSFSSIDTTSDITGHGHYGEVFGAMKIPDRFGKPNCAYEFDGNSYINVNNPDSLLLNNFTITYWVKPYQITPSGQYHYTISMGGFGGDNSMSINNNGYYGFVAGAYNLTAPISIASNGLQIVPNRWYFVGFSRSANKLSLYIDGNLAAEDVILNGSLPNYGNNQKVTMGVRCTRSSGSYLTGALDDVRFYRTVLSIDEITSLFSVSSIETTKVSDIEFYPNPTTSIINIKSDTSIEKYLEFTINDMLGRTVQRGKLTESKVLLNEELTEGIYLLKLHDANGSSIIKKIIKK